MNIETLLDLDAKMTGNAPEALEVLQKTWEAQDKPKDPEKLIRVLSRTMDRCQREGILYPRIFLKRKGQLQRREFKPKEEMRSMAAPDAITYKAGSHPKIPAEWIRQAEQEFMHHGKKREAGA